VPEVRRSRSRLTRSSFTAALLLCLLTSRKMMPLRCFRAACSQRMWPGLTLAIDCLLQGFVPIRPPKPARAQDRILPLPVPDIGRGHLPSKCLACSVGVTEAGVDCRRSGRIGVTLGPGFLPEIRVCVCLRAVWPLLLIVPPLASAPLSRSRSLQARHHAKATMAVACMPSC